MQAIWLSCPQPCALDIYNLIHSFILCLYCHLMHEEMEVYKRAMFLAKSQELENRTQAFYFEIHSSFHSQTHTKNYFFFWPSVTKSGFSCLPLEGQ